MLDRKPFPFTAYGSRRYEDDYDDEEKKPPFRDADGDWTPELEWFSDKSLDNIVHEIDELRSNISAEFGVDWKEAMEYIWDVLETNF